MRLDVTAELKQKGYYLAEGLFSQSAIEQINTRIDQYLLQNHEGIVFEQNSNQVRAIHGPHLYDFYFNEVCKNEFLLRICGEFIGDQIYIHQMKINMKAAMEGQHWPWHQDQIYWQQGDNIAKSDLINAAIFLGHIRMEHGPLCVIPESHKQGNLCIKQSVKSDDWSQDVASDLTYQVPLTSLKTLVDDQGIEFILGAPGDVLFFDPQLVHCSSNNLSVDSRRLLIITYNSVNNTPVTPSKRPAFLCNNDYTPINPIKCKDLTRKDTVANT
jgi:ectoine hydroxylase